VPPAAPGAGAHLKYWPNLTIVHVTDGAPRDGADARREGFSSPDGYAKARREELGCALREGEAEHARLIQIGVPDQEAIANIGEVIQHLRQALAGYEVVITHPYEGGHPDHDACAFAVHHAVELNRARGGGRPLILESPFYHAGPSGFEVGTFLKADGWMPEVCYRLSEEEKERKQRLVACFRTQKETLSGFHDETERFRIAPVYDFSRPAHEGKVLYEHYPWGMTSDRFCELAQEAETELEKEWAGKV